MRETTPGFDSAISGDHFEACHLAELSFDLPTDTVYVTDAGHSIDWGGHTYIGVGAAGNIDVVREVTSKEIVAVRFALTGSLQAFRNLALQENCNGRPAILRVAVIENGAVVNDPPIEFQGRLGSLSITDEKNTDTGDINTIISVTAESRSAGSRRPHANRHSTQDHHVMHPTDNIHRFIPNIVGQQHAWPRASYWRR